MTIALGSCIHRPPLASRSGQCKRFVPPLTDRSRTVKYQKSIVTYLDILGFRQLVSAKSVNDIHRILEALGDHAKPDEKSTQQFDMHFVTFSDCTVRTVPLNSSSNERYPSGLLFHEILSLVHAQYRLLCDGY
jgi:hypothetical protein